MTSPDSYNRSPTGLSGYIRNQLSGIFEPPALDLNRQISMTGLQGGQSLDPLSRQVSSEPPVLREDGAPGSQAPTALSAVWNLLRSPETDLQPDFYKLDITLGRAHSFYKNLMVTEPMISTLVGLETYKALNFRWPELYWPLNVDMTPQKAYLDLIDSIGSSSQIPLADFGRMIKTDLVRMTVDGGETQGVAGALVSTSLSIRHFDIPLKDRLFFTIWCVIWIIVTLYVLCRMGFVQSLLYPKQTELVSIRVFN